ncbi:hypothetical protein PANT_19c00092 [Moesziomyces antarcticus T-34]|uniref:Nucleolar protein 9 n=1 Tax=Pseudozyma antarctica (strain T-34) TaxID=1151754 RepID=M9MHH6_PSEA3|nr:hypothetical protein PANT_19c00092 [Moesziomyces antarcticus T-34]
MPPKIRQRGKKPSKLRKLQEDEAKSKQEQPVASTSNQVQTQVDYIALDNTTTAADASSQQPQQEDGQPNWVRLGERSSKAEHEAPFGYVDAELKAYLRAGWERATELETQGYSAKSTMTALAAASSGASDATHPAGNGDEEQEEDELALLLQATLKEMDGKELLLSTDPDTSLIVEAILHRLPAKPLRVFVDRLAGNFAVLSKHRFASHVVQACLATLQPAVTLEHATQQHLSQHQHRRGSATNGKAAASSAFASDTATIVNEDGVLRSATQLILDIAEELASDQAQLAALVSDAFGSHVLRSLLCVLMGRNIQMDTSSSAHAAAAADLRSRRSAKFRTRKAPTSVAGSGAEDLLVVIPDLLYARAATLRSEILGEAGTDVVRRWAADAVASPLLQLLIDAEVDALGDAADEGEWSGSLVDLFLGGFVSKPPTAGEGEVERDVYLETSLRDSVASHALQLALERAPAATAARFFAVYIHGRMAKLCVHPAANHIVAALLRRLSAAELAPAIAEMGKVATGMVKEQMIGCLQAAVERVGQLCDPAAAVEGDGARELVKAVSGVVLGAFRLKAKAEGEEGMELLVPTVLALKTRKAYLHTFAAHLKHDEAADQASKKRGRDGKPLSKSKAKSKAKYAKVREAQAESDEEQVAWTMDAEYEVPPAEATVQGSLLLQSLLRLPGPSAPPRGPVKRTFGRPTAAAPVERVEVFGSALVLESLLALPTLAPFARNPTAVHTLIAALTPPTTPATTGLDAAQANRRRKLGGALVAQLAHFCGDKYGSRLADQLWYTSDGYSKEKIAKTVVENSDTILRGAYAGYFTNKLQLQLFRKGKMREWTQAIQSQPPPHKDAQQTVVEKQSPIVVATSRKDKSTKRKIDGQLDAILDTI